MELALAKAAEEGDAWASYQYKGWQLCKARARLCHGPGAKSIEGLHHSSLLMYPRQLIRFATATSRSERLQGTRASRKIWLGSGSSTARTSNPLRTSSSRLFAASKTWWCKQRLLKLSSDRR